MLNVLHVELLKEVVALVVAHDEGWEILDLDLPDSLHTCIREHT